MDSDRRLFIFIVALDASFNAKEVNLKDAGDGEKNCFRRDGENSLASIRHQ